MTGLLSKPSSLVLDTYPYCFWSTWKVREPSDTDMELVELMLCFIIDQDNIFRTPTAPGQLECVGLGNFKMLPNEQKNTYHGNFARQAKTQCTVQ
jgi:hypothetical protein